VDGPVYFSNLPDVDIHCSFPGVIYLDVKAQMSLGYRVLQYLSHNTYARKITGYLYAIEVCICEDT